MHVRQPGVHEGRVRAPIVRAIVPLFAMAIPILSGCPNQELAAVLPCTQSVGRAAITQVGTNQVDLLFVVDDSPSMVEEQKTLSAELPRLVRVLTSGDLDDDGSPDFPAIDLHVGAISPNLGGYAIEECAGAGDDARLRWGETCGTPVANAPTHLSFEPGSETADDTRVSCMVELGTSGCGFEQQLEAALKALTPSTSDIVFREGTGQGDTANAGFLRESSLVVVLVVTDEDDCSAPSLGFISSVASTDVNLACVTKTGELHPVSRYVEGLRALRPNRADGVLFAAITGVPEDLVEDPERIDFDAILADERMTIRSNGEPRPEPEPACKRSEVAKAGPARRIVETARGFGANGIVQSICKADYRGALTAVMKRISELVGGACIPRPLNPNADGLVDCNVVETLPDGERCEGKASRTFVDVREGRERCRVDQVAVRDGAPQPGNGWYYDAADTEDYCPEGTSRIRFTQGADPVPGARVDLECLQPLLPSAKEPRNLDAIGTACDAAKDECPTRVDAEHRERITLFCDRRTNTCEQACAADADCRDPMVCDLSQERPYCVNPTCAGN